jgi:hypothetical protein
MGKNPFKATGGRRDVFNEVIIDSRTMKVHRHGGGGDKKEAADEREEPCGDKHEVSCSDNE